MQNPNYLILAFNTIKSIRNYYLY